MNPEQDYAQAILDHIEDHKTAMLALLHLGVSKRSCLTAPSEDDIAHAEDFLKEVIDELWHAHAKEARRTMELCDRAAYAKHIKQEKRV